jgi:2'-5' RNA ligase
MADPGVTGVDRLDGVDVNLIYQAALVFGLPHELAAIVSSLRAKWALPAPPEHQLVPHLTVLFLGNGPGLRLQPVLHALYGLLPIAKETCVNGVGTFRSSAGTANNVHLLAEATGLHQLHRRAYEVCCGSGWEPADQFLFERYVPHISVFDRIAVEGEVIDRVLRSADARSFQWKGTLTDLHVIGKVLAS